MVTGGWRVVFTGRELARPLAYEPLLWISRRLGHRSIETTAIYLHTLQELEMETRLALVPDWWEHTGPAPADDELGGRKMPRDANCPAPPAQDGPGQAGGTAKRVLSPRAASLAGTRR